MTKGERAYLKHLETRIETYRDAIYKSSFRVDFLRTVLMVLMRDEKDAVRRDTITRALAATKAKG